MNVIRFVTTALLVVVGAGALVAAPTTAARADSAPVLSFTTTEVTVPFGGDWLVELQITGSGEFGEVDPAWGTVDISLDDVPGVYSAGLPIMRGGLVYFARPTTAPMLPAGEHRATAVFRPGSPGLLEARTQTPLVITITPLALAPALDVLEVAGDEAAPYAVLTLAGEYVGALGTPAGSWSVSVDRDGTQVQQTAVDVRAGEGAVNLSLADLVRPGATLVVTAAFTPHPVVAAGVLASETESREIDTPALTPVEWLTRSLAVPWWALAVSAALLVGAIVAAIVVAVRYRRRKTPKPPAKEDATSEQAGEPDEPISPALARGSIETR